ncbi:YjbH domain-containing protein [Escherichia coli]
MNYRDNNQYRYYSASVQLFPWLETTLRYTDVRTRQYSRRQSIYLGDQTYKDKPSISNCVCGRSYWLPQVAVGARDIGGTGCLMRNILLPGKSLGAVRFYARPGLGISGHQR